LQDLFVTCEHGFDGGHTPRYHVEVYEASDRYLVHNMTRSLPAFYVRQLKPVATYSLVVYASNALGRSRTTQKMNITTTNETSPGAEGGGGRRGTDGAAAAAAVEASAADAAAASSAAQGWIKQCSTNHLLTFFNAPNIFNC
jgi:hypothetical protein